MLSNVVLGSSAAGQFQHVVVEMISGGECGERLRQGNISVHSLGMTRGRFSASAALRFVRVLRRERPSILQSWLYHADLLGLLALPTLGIPVVWNIRCAWHLGIHQTAPRLCAHLSRLPAAVVVNSHAGQRQHEELGYRPRRWCYIGNGFDLEKFKPDEQARVGLRAELGITADALLVGLVGRWDPHKDHETFLVAASQLHRSHAGVNFILVGEGLTPDNPVLGKLIEDLRLRDCVHLLGSRSDVARVTAALDVASCTSIAEAFPNVVGEAMAAGVPCVATNVGDAAMVAGDLDMIVPPRDPLALSNAWSRILSMAAPARQAIGAKARARIGKNYSISTVIGQYEQLYAELAARSL